MNQISKITAWIDEKYDITLEERNKVIDTYMKEGRLSLFPPKEKKKAILLDYFAKLFEINKDYTEKEINQIIRQVYDDFVTIRRYLVDYEYLDRLTDGSKYWIRKD
jgi:hypothetical protein